MSLDLEGPAHFKAPKGALDSVFEDSKFLLAQGVSDHCVPLALEPLALVDTDGALFVTHISLQYHLLQLYRKDSELCREKPTAILLNAFIIFKICSWELKI